MSWVMRRTPCPHPQFPKILHGFFGKCQIHSRRGFVCDDQSWLSHKRGGQEHSPDHSAGALKRIFPIHLFGKAVSLKQSPLLFSFFPVHFLPRTWAPTFISGSRYVVLWGTNAIRFPRSCSIFSLSKSSPSRQSFPVMGIVGKESQHRMCQETFAGTAGAHYRHNLPHVQKPRAFDMTRKLYLPAACIVFILPERDAQILYFQYMSLVCTTHTASYLCTLFGSRIRRSAVPPTSNSTTVNTSISPRKQCQPPFSHDQILHTLSERITPMAGCSEESPNPRKVMLDSCRIACGNNSTSPTRNCGSSCTTICFLAIAKFRCVQVFLAI